MTRFVRTTADIIFEDMDTYGEDGFAFERIAIKPGLLCRVGFEGSDRIILVPVEHPKWFAEVRLDKIEEVNGMEFLAEVHAGKIPDVELKETQ